MYSQNQPAPGTIRVIMLHKERTKVAGELVAEYAYWPGSDWWFATNANEETIGFWFKAIVAADLLERWVVERM